MVNKALGLIEVNGLLGAIIAADEALKSANVSLIGNRRIRGGLTTVHLVGDVESVKAAVEAGVNIVKNSNMYVSSHVIARLDEQVEDMIMKMLDQSKESGKVQNSNEKGLDNQINDEHFNEISNSSHEIMDKSEQSIQEQRKPIIAEESKRFLKEASEISKERLSKMRVVELRSLAYKKNIRTLTKKEIKFASKDILIQALLERGVNNE